MVNFQEMQYEDSTYFAKDFLHVIASNMRSKTVTAIFKTLVIHSTLLLDL